MATQRIHPTVGAPHTTVIVTETHVNAALLMMGRLIFGGYWLYQGSITGCTTARWRCTRLHMACRSPSWP